MPRITKINTDNIDIHGTSFSGFIHVDYTTLVKNFGEPTAEHDGYKVDAEWHIEFEDGTVATIYNWKDGYNYCGSDGSPVESITEWHVGGHGTGETGWIHDYINNVWPVFDEIRQQAIR